MTAPLYIPTPDEGECQECGREVKDGQTVCPNCKHFDASEYKKPEPRPIYGNLKEPWR